MKVAYNYETKYIDIEMEPHEIKQTIYKAVFPMAREAYKFYRDKGVPRLLSVVWGIETAHYLVPGIELAWKRFKFFAIRMLSVTALFLYYKSRTEQPFTAVVVFLLTWTALDFIRGFVKGYNRAKPS
jgi:hypothetical protein